MKPLSCVYIVAGIFTVLAISMYFAYMKKQEERAAVAKKEPFLGGMHGSSGEALRYGIEGTAGGAEYASVSTVEAFCSSDADCGVDGTCGVTGFCV